MLLTYRISCMEASCYRSPYPPTQEIICSLMMFNHLKDYSMCQEEQNLIMKSIYDEVLQFLHNTFSVLYDSFEKSHTANLMATLITQIFRSIKKWICLLFWITKVTQNNTGMYTQGSSQQTFETPNKKLTKTTTMKCYGPERRTR